jgi:hypothetical protein
VEPRTVRNAAAAAHHAMGSATQRMITLRAGIVRSWRSSASGSFGIHRGEVVPLLRAILNRAVKEESSGKRSTRRPRASDPPAQRTTYVRGVSLTDGCRRGSLPGESMAQLSMRPCAPCVPPEHRCSDGLTRCRAIGLPGLSIRLFDLSIRLSIWHVAYKSDL